MAAWKKGYDHNLLAQRLRRISYFDTSGRIALKQPQSDEFHSLVESAVEFGATLGSTLISRIVKQGVLKAALREGCSAGHILKCISDAERAAVSGAKREYVLLTSLSLGKPPRPFVRKFEGAVVRFESKPPSTFRRDELWERYRKLSNGELPWSYAVVRAYTSGYSELDAHDRASRVLNVIRGIWTLVVSRGQHRTSIGVHVPLGPFGLGPIHTIHEIDGTPSKIGCWFEDGFRGPLGRVSCLRLKRGRGFEGGIWAQLRACKYQEVVAEALARYALALDERDWDLATVKLWGILELLTDTIRDRQDSTTRRVSGVFRGNAWHLQVLRGLSDYRNRVVHASHSTFGNEGQMCRVKAYVEELILFHLRVGRKLASVREVGELLDLANRPEQLKSQMKLLRSALRMNAPFRT